jgi:hypothetical protein
LSALPPMDRVARIAAAEQALQNAGADAVIETIAQLTVVLSSPVPRAAIPTDVRRI